VFDGSTNLTLDNKGRLVIPTRYREKLLEYCGGNLVITGSADDCLLLYPSSDWEIVRQNLYALPNADPRVRYLQRRVGGQAVPAPMDAAGRVLVAPELREFAGLEKDVVLAGQNNKFELWNAQLWKANTRNSKALTAPFAQDQLPPSMAGFSL